MRLRMQLWLFPLVSLLLPLLVAPAIAQQINFIPDFSSPREAENLQLNNGSQLAIYQSNVVLRLTDGKSINESTSAYFKIQQPVSSGFTSYFAFKMHAPTFCCAPGDGFSFIIQNSTATNSLMGATGSGITAVGAPNGQLGAGAMGYAGINNSLAVEFDIFEDAWDPTSNHIAIQSCGGNLSMFNTPVHDSGVYTIGGDNDVTSCLLSAGAITSSIPTLGPTCSDDSCMDGAVHQVVIEYTPPMNQQQGTLVVYLDPTFQPGTFTPVLGSVPVLSVPYNLIYTPSNPLGLALSNTNQLIVGFTGSQPAETPRRKGQEGASGGTATDILAWQFTPHTPVQITQLIPNGGIEADYNFGAHALGVTYPSSFMNDNNIYMTVLGTPWNQQTFYTERLMGTDFANENCIIYLSTGGNCIVYSVTCQQNGLPVTCPSETEPTISICSEFYTSQPVSQLNTDFLEAEPIGSNNWCSIWTGFMQDPADPIVSGKGSGFSDIVATLSPTGPGMGCNGGSLEKLTKKMEEKQKPKQKSPPPQGSGFCPNNN